eukprot:5218002-Pleurochrysis_carterae.AAC.1
MRACAHAHRHARAHTRFPPICKPAQNAKHAIAQIEYEYMHDVISTAIILIDDSSDEKHTQDQRNELPSGAPNKIVSWYAFLPKIPFRSSRSRAEPSAATYWCAPPEGASRNVRRRKGKKE